MRSLSPPPDHISQDKLEQAKYVATEYLRRHFTDEEKEMFLSYAEADPVNWWMRLDKDTGGLLGQTLNQFGYSDEFMGCSTLPKLYEEIILAALDRSRVQL